MIAIKTEVMSKMPKYCDDCIWMFTRPHPHKGWTDGCELMNHCIDDDQPKEWVYDGNSRPKACPLINVDETKEGLEPKKGEWHNLIENPNDTPTKTRWYCCKKKSSDDLVMIFGYEEVISSKFDAWTEIYYPL